MLLARFIQCWCNIDSEAFPMSAQCHGGAIWVESFSSVSAVLEGRLFLCIRTMCYQCLLHVVAMLPSWFIDCQSKVDFSCVLVMICTWRNFFIYIFVLAQNDDTPSECHKSFCNTVMYVTDCCNSPSNGHYFVRAFPHRFKYWAKSSEGTKFTLRTTFLHHTTIFNVDGKQARNEQLVMKWTFCSAFLQKFASPQLSRKGKTSQVCIRSILY